MTSRATSSALRFFGWVTPFRVALLGTVAVILLLTAPIRIGPGDHERRESCGNALRMDLTQWRLPPPENYYDRAYQTCVSRRVDRIALAVGITSVTVLLVTGVACHRGGAVTSRKRRTRRAIRPT
jgi:hypothetical protein